MNLTQYLNNLNYFNRLYDFMFNISPIFVDLFFTLKFLPSLVL